MQSRLRSLLLPFLAILAVTLLFHFLTTAIPDPDSFYHLRHAWLYRTTSLFDTSFPWTYYSSIRTLGADIWYGMHILLIPLTYISDQVPGVKIGNALFTLLLLCTVLAIARRHKFALSAFWPLFFFLAIPNVLFQYLMMRPHILSLTFGMLLLSLLTRGVWWQVLLAATAITFFHMSFFWLGPLIAFAVLGVQVAGALMKKIRSSGAQVAPIGWVNTLLVLAGTALGSLLRPNPIEAAKIAYIQIVQILAEKSASVPLSFGRELAPLPIGELATTSTIFLVLWIGALAMLALACLKNRTRWEAIPPGERVFLLSSAGISGAFFLLTLIVARRSLVQWEAFGALGIAATYTYALPRKLKDYALGLLIVAFVIMIPYAIYRHNLNVYYTAFPYNQFEDAGKWLVEHSAPGDIVFNTHWDNFAALFFRDQKNYYIGGMDPIFQYAYSPALYWKFYYLSKDLMTNQTCGAYPCPAEPSRGASVEGSAEDTYTVLTRDFNAKYILVEPWRNPNFAAYLSGDPHYEKVFEAKTEMIFRVKR